MADRQPYPHAGGNRDHRRDSALTTAAANSAGTEPGIRTRALPANSISIAGSPHGDIAPYRRSALGRRNQHLGETRRPQRAAPDASDKSGPTKYQLGVPPRKRPRPAQSSPRQSPASVPRSTADDAHAPVITSNLAIAPSLAPVQALSFALMLLACLHPRCLSARRPSADGYSARAELQTNTNEETLTLRRLETLRAIEGMR